MKKIILLAFILIMLTTVASAVDVIVPSINITLLNQDPDPVTPGRYVELRFKIYNSQQNSNAKGFEVMLDPKFPFSLDSNEDAIRSIGDLPALGNTNNVVIVNYKVRVDDNAVEGANPIKILYRMNGGDWFGVERDINIQTVDANIAIVSVETIPENIKPGEKATINIKVKNMADSTMKDVSLKLDLTFSNFLSRMSVVTAADSIAAFNALPFAPLGSATEQKIDRLLPGEEKTFSYKLIAYSDAVSKVYKIPVELSYYDELMTSYTKDDLIGVVVGTKPELSIVIDSTELYVGKNSGKVVIKFINKGFTDIKFLNVDLEHTDIVDVISSHEVYLGNIDSNDYDTVEYTIYVNDGKKEGIINLPVKVDYRDSNNNVYEETYNLSLEIMDPKKLGISNNSGTTILFVVVIIIAGVIFLIRRKKRKSK